MTEYTSKLENILQSIGKSFDELAVLAIQHNLHPDHIKFVHQQIKEHATELKKQFVSKPEKVKIKLPSISSPKDSSSAGEPDAGKPDAGKPDAGKPDAGKPDANNPDANKPDANKPDANKPSAGGFQAGGFQSKKESFSSINK